MEKMKGNYDQNTWLKYRTVESCFCPFTKQLRILRILKFEISIESSKQFLKFKIFKISIENFQNKITYKSNQQSQNEASIKTLNWQTNIWFWKTFSIWKFRHFIQFWKLKIRGKLKCISRIFLPEEKLSKSTYSQ